MSSRIGVCVGKSPKASQRSNDTLSSLHNGTSLHKLASSAVTLTDSREATGVVCMCV